ncbi:hypothetical protein KY338_01925 [Candidatus Woesearchaeota archaeon]|nr:hypothetical protein [Candidatus Woesearchaeota archaeon]MBW3005965.1 hypothetical protein [Candidatus Woesearchaeota archaeon]
MKKLLLLLLFLVVLSAAASAQVLVSVEEKTVCGDGIREGHEMCEPDTDQDLCEAAGKVIGIAMVCDERDCTCLPKRMDCGNEIREGAEFCDPGEKEDKEENDFCPALGNLFNETFTCDPDTCLCKPETIFGAEPPAICGDGNITRDEECEKDEDCRADYECKNCSCVRKEWINESVITEVKKNLTKKQEPEKKPKEEVKKTDYHDFVGVILPDYLQKDFQKARVNVYIELENGSTQVVGVTTLHNVVQEIEDEKLSSVNYDVFVKKKKANAILNADDQGAALKKAFDDGSVTYKPKGLFSRFWAWLVGLFS